MTITMSFDPVADASIFSLLSNAPNGKRAEVALGLMKNGASAVSISPAFVAPVIGTEIVMDSDDSFM